MLNITAHQHHIKRVKAATDLCEAILRDIRVRDKLQLRYPNTFLQLRYEDVAKNTMDSLDSLYNFIGLAVPDGLKKWVHRATHARSEKVNENAFGIKRTDSSLSLDVWHSGLSADFQTEVSNHPLCQELFEYANYPLH